MAGDNLFYRYGMPVDGKPVTPSNSVDLPIPGVLYVGTAGDVKVNTMDGTTLTFKNRPSGSILPLAVRRVHDTGTSAQDMIVMYGHTDGE